MSPKTKKKKQAKAFKSDWKRYYSFLRENGLTKRLILFTIFFRLFVSSLNIVGIGLLIPLAKGVIEQDFSFIGEFLSRFPQIPYLHFLQDMEYLHAFFLLAFLIFLSCTAKNFALYFGGKFLLAERLKIGSNTNRFIFNNYLKLGRPFYDASEGASESFFFMRFSRTVTNLLSGGDKFIDIFVHFTSLTILMLALSWKLYLLTLLVLPVFMTLNKKLREFVRSSIDADVDGELKFPVTVNNAFSRMPLAFVHNNEGFESRSFFSACQGFERKRFEMMKKMSLLGPINETIVFVVLLITALSVGYMTHRGFLDVAVGLVFFLVFKQFIGLAFNLFMAQFGVIRSLRAIDQAFQVIDKFEGEVVPTGTKRFTGLKEKIEIKDLSFTYPKGKRKVLKNVNLTIPKGSIVSIIGRSGSGKSTFVSVLLRLYDCPPGSLIFDGVDVREFSNKTIRQHISFVGQDPILFKDTLYNNIVYGSKKYIAKKKVMAILESFDMGYLVHDTKDGLDARISGNGRNLSGGEKQRVALARALVNEAEIVILDEPTSAVDALTEAEIKSAIDKFTEGKTVLMLAHRLSTVKGSDKVAVMEHGKIVEKGKIKELLKADKRFAEYWKSQSLEI